MKRRSTNKRSKLKRAAGDTAAADELWTRSQFAQLEDFVVTQLTDKKEAAKVKLMSPLGVAERFLLRQWQRPPRRCCDFAS